MSLARFKSLFVIAQNSTFVYKGKSPDIRQVGRELGVRYVLEGSVRKVGDRIRISGQLIDAANATHLWADRFDGALEDVFELQDRVTANVVGIIAPRDDAGAAVGYLRAAEQGDAYARTTWAPCTPKVEVRRRIMCRPTCGSIWQPRGPMRSKKSSARELLKIATW